MFQSKCLIAVFGLFTSSLLAQGVIQGQRRSGPISPAQEKIIAEPNLLPAGGGVWLVQEEGTPGEPSFTARPKRRSGQPELINNQIVEAQEGDEGQVEVRQVLPSHRGHIIEMKSVALVAQMNEWEKDGLIGESLAVLSEAHKQMLAGEHQMLRARLQELKHLEVKDEFQLLFNGMVVRNLQTSDFEKVKSWPEVKTIHPNALVQTTTNESIPLIKANQVWSLPCPNGNCQGQGTTIAIIDTGVDYTHPDLGGCMGPNCKVIGGFDFANNDNVPLDDHGHGTHVAATAAGNGVLKGVAPQAKLLAYKVLSAGGSGYTSDVILGIERSLDPNQDGAFADKADIVNLSVGAVGNPDDPLSQAVDNAVNQGIIVVAAAGNNGQNGAQSITSPGTARNAITVGAVYKTKQLAYFSSLGPVVWGSNKQRLVKPDVVAPGVNICAAQWQNAWASSQCIDQDHVSISGTSMATPHVAGMAALLKQKFPSWTPLQIKSAIRRTAKPLAEPKSFNEQGVGLVDVYDPVVSFNNDSGVGIQLAAIQEPFATGSSVATISGQIQTTYPGLVDKFQIAFAPALPLSQLNENSWTVIKQADLPAGGIISESWDTKAVPAGDYWLRLRANASNGYFYDYGMVAVKRFVVQEPLNGNMVNPNTEIMVKINNPSFQTAVSSYIVEHSFEGGGWNSGGVSLDPPTLLGSFVARIAPNTFTQNGELKIRARFAHDGIEDIVEMVNLRVDTGLKLGWPIHIPFQSNPSGGYYGGIRDVAVGDVIGDSKKELVVLSKGDPSKLMIFSAEGLLLNEIAVEVINQSSPLLVDLDNDGKNEILIYEKKYNATGNCLQQPLGKLFAYRGDGSILDHWPVTLWQSLNLVCIASDLNHDGQKEIVAQEYAACGGAPKGWIINANGTIRSTWQGPLWTSWGGGWAPPAVGNFDSDPDLEVVTGFISEGLPNQKSQLFVYNHDGTVLPGWPVTIPALLLTSAPAVADVNGDGQQEIIVGSIYSSSIFPDPQFGGLYAFNRNGQLLSGWPFLKGYNFWSNAAIAEFQTGRRIVASRLGAPDLMPGGTTYQLNSNATLAPGWPKVTTWSNYTSDMVAGLQSNGLSIFNYVGGADLQGDWINAWTDTGESLPGFPKLLQYGGLGGLVQAADLDNDGKPELIASSQLEYDISQNSYHLQTSLHVWKTDGYNEKSNRSWPIFHHDSRSSGCLDCPPAPSALLSASDAAAYDHLGTAVAINGDRAIAAAKGGTPFGDEGAAYIFEKNGEGVWSSTAKLIPSDHPSADYDGWSVALKGDTALVGVRHLGLPQGGRVYVLKKFGAGKQIQKWKPGTGNGSPWQEIAILQAAGGSSDNNFGAAIAMSEDGQRIVVGAPFEGNTTIGAAYVFERNPAGGWAQTAKLNANLGYQENMLMFGAAVSISGNTIVVGAPQAHTPSGLDGLAFVFEKQQGNWVQTQELHGDVFYNNFNDFGSSVAISGDDLIVGAPGGTSNGVGLDAAYVFSRGTNGFQLQAKLKGALVGNHKFGQKVAIQDGIALISAHKNLYESVYLFKRMGSWVQSAKIDTPSNQDIDFGRDLALDCNHAVIGAPNSSLLGAEAGSVYIYPVFADY